MNRLKQLRLEKKLLQEDIAKFLDISISAIGFYENEKRDMSPQTIIKLAEFFNVSTDYILGKSDIRNPEEIKSMPHDNSSGLNTEGLDEYDLLELQKQVDYIKKLKAKK